MPYKDKYERHKKGLCSQCPNPVKPFFKRCDKCLDVDRKTSRVRQAKVRVVREKEGLCVKCATPLNEDADRNKINCINCREGTKWNYLIKM